MSEVDLAEKLAGNWDVKIWERGAGEDDIFVVQLALSAVARVGRGNLRGTDRRDPSRRLLVEMMAQAHEGSVSVVGLISSPEITGSFSLKPAADEQANSALLGTLRTGGADSPADYRVVFERSTEDE